MSSCQDQGTGPRPARLRVLIVDDQDETREMYAWCMRAAGWMVEGSVDGEEAFIAARVFHPHVIVMDLRLPRFDGLDAIRLLKGDDDTRHIPIVVCSGAERRHAEMVSREAGCAAFVSKPCLPDDLRALLEEVVADHPEFGSRSG
jgi:two-component system cell cycle response regulator DivK